MKEFATSFYTSRVWADTRRAYRKSVGGLCERCLANGRIVPGEIVHHKIHLTPDNINNPSITLSFDNLELVCRECHAIEHGAKIRRYKVDEFGRVTLPPGAG
jgi:5-methylcytosine-specific restriction endonuclease McrA